MKFDLTSDLHVDINQSTVRSRMTRYPLKLGIDWAKWKNPGSDLLAICGDTANRWTLAVDVAKDAAEVYQHVVVLMGNHESYSLRRATVDDCSERMREALSPIANVTYLDGGALVHDSTLFIGECGWYDWKILPDIDRELAHARWRYKKASNDRQLRFAPGRYPDKMAHRQAENLADWVALAQGVEDIKHIVVLTHTVPIVEAILRFPGSPADDELSPSYGNSEMIKVVEADVNQKIKVWCFGHSHDLWNFTKDHVRYVAAPRGYEFTEKREWKGPVQIDTEQSLSYSAFGEIERDAT